MRRGMTLIEVMVSLGLIAVLIAITVPALSGARIKASELQSLANARHVAADMQSYADQFGHWPYSAPGSAPPGYPTTPPPNMLTVLWWPSIYTSVSSHWDHSYLWPGLVAVVAPWEEHFQTWISPGAEPSTLFNDTGVPASAVHTSYLYSNSFIASPRVWRGSSSADPTLIAPTRPSDVAHPANKTLVWDWELPYLPQRPMRINGHFNRLTPMAFADGHGAVHNPLNAIPGVTNPFNNTSTNLSNTPHGVLGRDY